MHMPLRFVESKYKLEIGAAQTTQLAKAITTGAEKGVFILPKGMLWRSIFYIY
jgi:histone H1/5